MSLWYLGSGDHTPKRRVTMSSQMCLLINWALGEHKCCEEQVPCKGKVLRTGRAGEVYTSAVDLFVFILVFFIIYVLFYFASYE